MIGLDVIALCGETSATLAGVNVGKLSCCVDSYWSRVCNDPVELASEVNRRVSLLSSLRPKQPSSGEDENYHQCYFGGQQALFADEGEELDQVVTLVDKLIDVYNEVLAPRLEGRHRLLREAGSEEQEHAAMFGTET